MLPESFLLNLTALAFNNKIFHVFGMYKLHFGLPLPRIGHWECAGTMFMDFASQYMDRTNANLRF